jgi:hypothetical protein
MSAAQFADPRNPEGAPEILRQRVYRVVLDNLTCAAIDDDSPPILRGGVQTQDTPLRQQLVSYLNDPQTVDMVYHELAQRIEQNTLPLPVLSARGLTLLREILLKELPLPQLSTVGRIHTACERLLDVVEAADDEAGYEDDWQRSAKLQELKLSGLVDHAIAYGAPEAARRSALDSDNPKDELIELIIRLQRATSTHTLQTPLLFTLELIEARCPGLPSPDAVPPPATSVPATPAPALPSLVLARPPTLAPPRFLSTCDFASAPERNGVLTKAPSVLLYGPCLCDDEGAMQHGLIRLGLQEQGEAAGKCPGHTAHRLAQSISRARAFPTGATSQQPTEHMVHGIVQQV